MYLLKPLIPSPFILCFHVLSNLQGTAYCARCWEDYDHGEVHGGLQQQQQQSPSSLDLLPLLPVPPVGAHSHGNNGNNNNSGHHNHTNAMGALHVPTSPVGQGGGWSHGARSPHVNPSSPGNVHNDHHSRLNSSRGANGFSPNGNGAMPSPVHPAKTAVAPAVGPSRCWVLSDNTHLLNQVRNNTSRVRTYFYFYFGCFYEHIHWQKYVANSS